MPEPLAASGAGEAAEEGVHGGQHRRVERPVRRVLDRRGAVQVPELRRARDGEPQGVQRLRRVGPENLGALAAVSEGGVSCGGEEEEREEGVLRY